jgi:EmrB/QacA subfamily drug resistance transporter
MPSGATSPGRDLPMFVIPLIVATAFLMEAIDQTIITACIPAIAGSLHTTALSINLAITSYLLSLAVFIPISGWTADRVGARRVFVCSIMLFVVGSILCGFAASLEQLVAARILQGLGGALMTPTGRLLLIRSVDRKDLVIAIAYMTTPVLLGPLLGPIIGGYIASYYNWRWIFFINIPVGLLGIVLAMRYIPRSPAGEKRPFDFTGFLLCALLLVAVQVVVENGTHTFLPHGSVPFIIGLAVLAGALYARHWRGRPWPAVDLSLFSIRTFTLGVLAGGLCRIGLNAIPFLLQLQLQIGFGFTALHAGLVIFALAGGSLVMKPFLRLILSKHSYKSLLIVNSLVAASLSAGLFLLTPRWPELALIAYLFLFGFFRSLQFNVINTLIYFDVPKGSEGQGVSVAGVAQQLSMGLGISLSAAAIAQLAGSSVTFDAADMARVFPLAALVILAGGLGFTLMKGSRKREDEISPETEPDA